MTRADLLEALQHPNVEAFLRVIREGESSQGEDAYTVLYGGSHFESFADHPRKRFPIVYQGKPNYTTAAGAFQIVERTWNEFTSKFGASSFDPKSQSMCAVWRIAMRGALEDVKAGRIDAAIRKLPQEWTSLALPKRIAQAAQIYQAYGGQLAAEPTHAAQPQEKAAMIPVPLITAGISILSDLIPAISSIFKPGSEVAARNVQAAQVIFDTVSKATDSPNVQAAIERMQSDPQAMQAATEAVHEILPQLIESGGGGIDGARKAAMSADQIPFYKQPAVLFVAATLPLVYAIVAAVVMGWGGRDFSDEVKVMVVTAILGLLGTAGAYFLGSSNSSQKKDAGLIAAAGK